MEFANLYSKKVSKFTYKTHHTSGSSGEKLSFLLPNDLVYKKNTAFLYRFYSMWGVNPKDKRVTLGGRIFTNRAPYWITNWFENQLLMSTHHLNFQTVDSYISRIIRFNPIFMQGHPSAILFMAKYILSIKKHVPFNLRVIFSTGETLLMEDQEIIETAFQCKVAQQYGSGENCFSAQQAPNNNAFLINYEHGLIELIGENDLREVVVTSFQNNVMPFIRYKMNDFVKIVEPSFSELYGLPILFNQIVGRTDDVIQLRNGTIIFPVSIRMKIKPFLLAGTNYQLVQISYLQFILNLVDVNRSLLIDQIIKNLNSVLGFDVNIDICFVDTLITKGGKIRNIISHIK
jgi:phenylacetate-CoA ligase